MTPISSTTCWSDIRLSIRFIVSGCTVTFRVISTVKASVARSASLNAV